MLRRLNAVICLAISLLTILLIPVSAMSDEVDDFFYYNEETDYIAYVIDEAGLFKGSETKALLNTMIPITEYANAVLYTTDYDYYGDTEKLANEFLLENFGDDVNAVVFVIDMDCRLLTVWSDGTIRSAVEPKGTTITDNVYEYAADGEYYECALEAFSEIRTVIEGGKIAAPMKYLSNACLAVILSLIFTYFIARKSSSTSKATNNEVMNSIYSKLDITNVKAVYTGSTREYSPRESSSSSGGSSGGGGGGGGGGGSHGF